MYLIEKGVIADKIKPLSYYMEFKVSKWKRYVNQLRE